MKILLLGEYSSFNMTLRNALKHLGHEVKLFCEIDKYKNINNPDFIYFNSKLKKLNPILNSIYAYLNFKEWDIIHLIDFNIFGGLSYNLNGYMIKILKKRCKIMSLSSCGSNYYTYKIKDKLRYNYFDENIKVDLNGRNRFIERKFRNANKFVANIVDVIIPVNYDYALAYEKLNKNTVIVPLPIDINNVKYIPLNLISNEKIVIMHGITEIGFKGSELIINAMKRVKENYPDRVQLDIFEKVPLKDYFEKIQRAHIFIDQARSYGYGMNALYAMASGKVVLSGNEPENREYFGNYDIPVINILPEEDNIYNTLENLIFDHIKLNEISKKSRLFVEKFHEAAFISKKYLEIWNI